VPRFLVPIFVPNATLIFVAIPIEVHTMQTNPDVGQNKILNG